MLFQISLLIFIFKQKKGFLERIVITDLKDPKVNYYCLCSKWLDKNKDDGLISRVLEATDNILSIRKEGKYKITTFTGDKRNSGTDADVKIVLYGNLGDSGEWKLDDSKNNLSLRGGTKL